MNDRHKSTGPADRIVPNPARHHSAHRQRGAGRCCRCWLLAASLPIMAAPPPQMRDWYQVLGVARDADAEEIKRVYRQLALELHPDRSRAASDVERFKQISEAYRVLSDAGQRQLIDDYLEQRSFRRASFRGEDSFVDRLAGIRRPRRRQPGEGAATARAFRFLEVALSPRMLLIGGGLAFMGYIALGPRDEAADDHMMVHAWFNPSTKRWETPAPWNPDYRLAVANRQHARVHKYQVFESAPPTAAAAASAAAAAATSGEGRGAGARAAGTGSA